jgi:catechol 2,3-dioxygenase
VENTSVPLLGPVRLQVADLGRSIDYYTSVLGLRVAEHEGSDAALAPRDDARVLVRLHEHPGATRAPRRGALGLFHFALLVPDRAALGRLIAHLAALDAHVGSADHAVSEAIYLTDPDGLGIEVYRDRPRSEWRRLPDGQLYMTTDPLDIHGVVSAGGGAPWTGMPAGTVMGHVHLHVGDLGKASEFFHGALGFDKTVWSYPGALFMSVGGYHHHLGTNTWSSGPPPAPDQAQLLSWEFRVADVAVGRATADRLRAAGSPVTEADGVWTVADPWGTRLRIVAGNG